MAEPSASTSTARQSILTQPFSIQWRKALVSLPRLVPLQAMKYTSAEGPQPFILNFPSRGKYLIPIYCFVPPNPSPEHSAHGLPVVLDFHGGGFVLGSCLEQGPFCAKLARDLGAVVLCVDYRMGPIDKFPAAIEDGEDILSAVLDENSKGGKDLREAIASRLSSDAKKALKKARKLEKKEARAIRKAEKKDAKAERKGESSLGNRLLRPTLSKTNTTINRPGLSRLNSRNASRKSLSRTLSSSSLSLTNTSKGITPQLTRTNTGLSTASAGSSTDDLALPDSAILDTTRLALSGFSSGSNLALNLALSVSPSSDTVPPIPTNWASRFPASYPAKIPLLLYYPSFDVRQLPSERTNPPGLEPGGGFWSDANDMLMPTYVPRAWAAHPRASPGLADLGPPPPPNFGISSAATSRSVSPSPSITNNVPTSNPSSQSKEKLDGTTAPSANATSAAEAASAATVKEKDRPAPITTTTAKATSTVDNVPPPGLHPQAKCQLILPVLDSLSEQSEIWIKKVKKTGRTVYEWNYEEPASSGPGAPSGTAVNDVDKKAAKKADKIKKGTVDAKKAPAVASPSVPSTVPSAYEGPRTDLDLEVLRYPNQKHGWTQMPEGWLDEAARRTRLDCFEKSIAFVRKLWNERERRELCEAVKEVEREERLIEKMEKLAVEQSEQDGMGPGPREGKESVEGLS